MWTVAEKRWCAVRRIATLTANFTPSLSFHKIESDNFIIAQNQINNSLKSSPLQDNITRVL
jgi:hypothetical protein